MAFAQIDPARLDGDAPRRWSMRSPADTEQERQQAAAQRYQKFFGSRGALIQAQAGVRSCRRRARTSILASALPLCRPQETWTLGPTGIPQD